MTREELDLIATELDTTLPRTYVEFMLDYPASLACTEAVQYELLNAPEWIVKYTRELRLAPGVDWPEEYLVIGHSGCGDYYAIDLDDEDPVVVLWNHEIGDFDDDEEAESIEEHAGRMLELHRDRGV